MRRAVLVAVLISFFATLAGCAQGNVDVEDAHANVFNDPTLQIVAVDLVSVIGQMPHLDPWSTTLQLSPTHSAYGHAVINALIETGYGIQRVSADQGINHVKHKETETIGSSGKSNSFEIEIGDIRVARNYERTNGRWIPSSPIRIFGAEPTRIILFNGLHAGAKISTRFKSGVVFHDASGDVIESRESLVSVINRNTDANRSAAVDVTQRALRLSQASTFTRQRASAADDKQNYRPIAEVVVRFPSSNPNTLGPNNKQALANLLKNADMDTDRFVIQGCSHWNSLLWDGTESISLERQQRVNKEFIVSGVAPTSIQELNCYTNNTYAELPRQSVRVVLERLVTSH